MANPTQIRFGGTSVEVQFNEVYFVGVGDNRYHALRDAEQQIERAVGRLQDEINQIEHALSAVTEAIAREE